MAIDEKLLEFATPIQQNYLRKVIELGSQKAAAIALGVHRKNVYDSLKAVEKKAALAGYSPQHDMTHPAPDTHLVKGTSTLYRRTANGEQEQLLQWVKTDVDRDARTKLMIELIEEAAEDLPALPRVKSPKGTIKDLCTLYTITDAHVGMYAWSEEGGAEWDLEIAERVLTECFYYLIDAAPASSVGIIAQLGDLLHYDSLLPVTPTSKHILDASGRFSQMAHAAVRILRRIVDKALLKHEKVILVMAEGNHDMASSVWLRIMFKALYENNPRVEIIDNELPYYAYQHGKVMLGWHHSHLKKMDQLPLLMATQFHKMWGDTTIRHFHTGDQHHAHEKEYSGAIVTQHPTLAAKDAYAARYGYHALRTSTAITYHAEHGRTSTTTVSPEMIGG